jgi:hypothetical protein
MVLSLHVYAGTAASAVQPSEAQQSFRGQPTFNPTRALRDKTNPSATDLGNLTWPRLLHLPFAFNAKQGGLGTIPISANLRHNNFRIARDPVTIKLSVNWGNIPISLKKLQ